MTQSDKKKVKRIVHKVLDDLLDRHRFRQVWDGCNQKTKKEIRDSLVEIISKEMNRDISE